ncbi:IS3 family transposase [Caballeronia sp. EK]|nr:IS3 family transposase [Caballeronia sp. EK]
MYKAEVVHRRSWRTLEDVELATLEWVHWYNHHRLLGPLGTHSLRKQRKSTFGIWHASLAA